MGAVHEPVPAPATLGSIFSPREVPSASSSPEASSAKRASSPPPLASMEDLGLDTPAPPRRRFSLTRSKQETPVTTATSVIYQFPDKYSCSVTDLTEEIVTARHVQMKSVSKLTLEAIVYKLAGKLGPLLGYYYSPTTGVHIATAIKNQLSVEDKDVYLFACVELTEQLLRQNQVQFALDEIFPVITTFYTPGQVITNPSIPYAARALIVYGRILTINQSYQAAIDVFDAALVEAVLAPLNPIVAERERTLATALRAEAATHL